MAKAKRVKCDDCGDEHMCEKAEPKDTPPPGEPPPPPPPPAAKKSVLRELIGF